VQDQGLPRFGSFKTFFHTETPSGGRTLFPGDFLTCDGQLVRITRIPNGSMADDDMELAVQEMN
jgi:hypothetical protein